MLTIKFRLPVNSTRFLVATGIIRGKEQKRYLSLNIQTLNPLVKEVEYAVRGPIVIRAGEIENRLKQKTRNILPQLVCKYAVYRKGQLSRVRRAIECRCFFRLYFGQLHK